MPSVESSAIFCKASRPLPGLWEEGSLQTNFFKNKYLHWKLFRLKVIGLKLCSWIIWRRCSYTAKKKKVQNTCSFISITLWQSWDLSITVSWSWTHKLTKSSSSNFLFQQCDMLQRCMKMISTWNTCSRNCWFSSASSLRSSSVETIGLHSWSSGHHGNVILSGTYTDVSQCAFRYLSQFQWLCSHFITSFKLISVHLWISSWHFILFGTSPATWKLWHNAQ